MCTVPMMKPLFRAHVIVFYSRRDGRALGWGIYSEFPAFSDPRRNADQPEAAFCGDFR